MPETAAPTHGAPGVAVERRRPGRVDYANPDLIALLRSPAKDGAAHPPGETALLGDTISPLDGASQIGTLQIDSDVCQDTKIAWHAPDEFLGNQVSYIAGVQVATTRGVIAAEAIAAGDTVITLSGQRLVTWTGRLRLSPMARKRPDLAAPVLVRREAIAPDLPRHDLLVAPIHCLLINDVLVPAGSLVNGTTITQEIGPGFVDYCHVLFDRYAHERLAVGPDLVAPIRAHLARRAAHLGYAAQAGDAGLHLLVDGRPVEPSEIDGHRHLFVVPPGRGPLRLRARSQVAIVKIVLLTPDGGHAAIPADCPDFPAEWDAPQRDGAIVWRCLRGSAALPVHTIAAGTMIAVHLKG